MSQHTEYTVVARDDGLRLEVWLARNISGLSRIKAIELIREGAVSINGKKARKGVSVEVGQTVRIKTPEPKGPKQTEEPTILFQNPDLLIADKPAGMPCHPLRFGEHNTLLQWISERFPEVMSAGPDPREGGLLHRLDTDTSGCVAFARTRKAFEKFKPLFLEKGVGKTYLAVVSDHITNGGPDGRPNGGTEDHYLPEPGKGVRVIDIPLARHPSDPGLMVALLREGERFRGEAMPARTEIRTLAKGEGCALVEAKIERGRMHQIRLHLASIGHPIIGDKTYNLDGGSNGRPNSGNESGSQLIGRQALHAWKLTIGTIEAVAPMPKDMKSLCEARGIRWPKR
jgi:23S rRNA pseudouridine1911/1915/1917 synthase